MLFATVLACLAAGAVSAGGLPDLTLPAGVGVNVHFTSGHGRDLDLIVAAGFKWVRQDFFWTQTEREKGRYDWREFDAFTAELEQHGLRAYYILDYSNPLYEEAGTSTNPLTGKIEKPATASPQHPESVAAFARWAGAAAEHFRGRGVIWEIWNEPNISFWKPKPDAAQYTALALAASQAIRAADPQACVVAPASSGFPWEFLDTVLASGVLEYVDAVSVHPYRGNSPETAAQDFARLRELIQRRAPKGKTIPILSGEWGYATSTNGVTLEKQAAYIARQQLSNLYNGVPLSIWYDWKNDGNNPGDREHNFGTVGQDLQPKPAYLAIQTLTRELGGYRIAGRLSVGATNDYVLTFTNSAGVAKAAAWTVGKPHKVLLEGQLEVQLEALPKYVSLPPAKPVPAQ